MDLDHLGRLVALVGLALLLVGGGLILASHLPFLGHLPGDILIQRDGFTLFIPLATMLLVSLVLTLLVNILGRLFR